MRLVLAGLFVYVVMMGTVGLFSTYAGQHAAPAWEFLLILPVTVGALWIALRFFNRAGYRALPGRKPLADYLAELEAAGLLDRQRFQATRAFGVAEYDDEGPHYYIALVDGGVLYLNGQYLYDYEPIDDDPDVNQPRSFPNSGFEILRHREMGHVIDIVFFGTVLEPEFMAAPYGRSMASCDHPSDGQVISSTSYDELTSAHMAPVVHPT